VEIAMVVLELGCRAALVVVFALAFAGKVRGAAAWRAFVQSLAAFGVSAAWARPPAAAAIAAVEAAAVVLLVASPAPGFALALALLAVFTGALVVALRRGQRAPCRCFGASERPIGPAHLARNAILLALACAGLAAGALKGSPSTALHDSIATLLTGGMAGFVVTRWDDLLFLFSAAPPTTDDAAGR
jgi:hypothetical protein